MIDPKLNEAAQPAGSRAGREGSLSDAQQEERLRRARAGLSINDTIAGEANLSVGGKGVDTSGVEAGAGAGAGSTHSAPTQSTGSPAPSIVPGTSGSGTTPRSDSGLTQNPIKTRDIASESAETRSGHGFPHHEIAARAYQCWRERGCPEGTPDIDWDRAENELRTEHQRSGKTTAAGA